MRDDDSVGLGAALRGLRPPTEDRSGNDKAQDASEESSTQMVVSTDTLSNPPMSGDPPTSRCRKDNEKDDLEARAGNETSGTQESAESIEGPPSQVKEKEETLPANPKGKAKATSKEKSKPQAKPKAKTKAKEKAASQSIAAPSTEVAPAAGAPAPPAKGIAWTAGTEGDVEEIRKARRAQLTRERRQKDKAEKDAKDRAAGKHVYGDKKCCQFCKAEQKNVVSHEENCAAMPFDVWIATLRSRQQAEYDQETRDSWTHQCQHCGTTFRDIFAKRVHAGHCSKRRVRSGLQTNLFPAVRVRGRGEEAE